MADPNHPVVALVLNGGFAHSWARAGNVRALAYRRYGYPGLGRDAKPVKSREYAGVCHFAPVNDAGIEPACGREPTRPSGAGDLAAILRSAVVRSPSNFRRGHDGRGGIHRYFRVRAESHSKEGRSAGACRASGTETAGTNS